MAIVTAVRNKTQSKVAMLKVIRYASQPTKTLHSRDGEKIRLLSGKDCIGEFAFQEFMATKKRYKKETGRYFYQYIQSFKPGEKVTPEQVHQIGLDLAEYFKGHEVVVATHIDRDHWHSHLIINSVSHETGRKLQVNKQDLKQLRDMSDDLCKAHGLTILPTYDGKQKNAGLGTREYRAALKGQSWKFALMAAIDRAMQQSHTKQDFIKLMEQWGYRVRWEPNRKHITYTTPEGHKCRDDRLHEDKYRKETMEELFERENVIRKAEAAERPDRGCPNNIHQTGQDDYRPTLQPNRTDRARTGVGEHTPPSGRCGPIHEGDDMADRQPAFIGGDNAGVIQPVGGPAPAYSQGDGEWTGNLSTSRGSMDRTDKGRATDARQDTVHEQHQMGRDWSSSSLPDVHREPPDPIDRRKPRDHVMER